MLKIKKRKSAFEKALFSFDVYCDLFFAPIFLAFFFFAIFAFFIITTLFF